MGYEVERTVRNGKIIDSRLEGKASKRVSLRKNKNRGIGSQKKII